MSRVIKNLPLTLAESYVSSWGLEEGVRELIQNGLDCINNEIYVEDGVLHINTYDGELSHKYLLLGVGSKTEDSKTRGMHCEGLCLVLLVLARSEVQLEFYNGKEKWTHYLEYNKGFEENCLHLRIEEYPEGISDSVKITIKGLDYEDENNFLDDKPLDSIIENTLILQDQGYSKHDTSYGEILLDDKHKGKVFCGGLFVQHVKGFQEGFNFKPNQLKLDRDRRMVQHLDLVWTCKDAWAEVTETAEDEVADYIVQGISNKSASMNYLDSARPDVSETIKNKVLEVYKEKYNGKILADSYEHKEFLQRAGNENADYIDNAPFLQILEQTDEYKEIRLGVKVEKPINYLDEWKEKHYDTLSDEALYDYEDMCIKLQKFLK